MPEPKRPLRPGSTAWTTLRQGALVAAISLVLFAALYVGWQYRNFLEMRRHTTGESFIEDNALVGYRLKPDSSFTSLDSGYTAQASNEGLRSRAKGDDSKGPCDILVAGCSFMWGDGVDYDQTFPAQLAKATGLKVDNAAVPSYSLLQGVLTVGLLADKKPRLVIFGFFDDQLPRSLSPCAPSLNGFCRPAPRLAYDPDRHGLAILPPPDLPYASSAVTEDYYLAKRFDAGFLRYAAWEDLLKLTGRDADSLRARALAAFHQQSTDAAAFDFLLGELARRTRAMGARLLFVHLPHPEAVRPLNAALHAVIAKYAAPDFVFADCADFLAGDARPLVVSAGNHHPNARYFASMVEHLRPVVDRLLAP